MQASHFSARAVRAVSAVFAFLAAVLGASAASSQTAAQNGQSCVQPQPGPIAWWPFDNSPNDIAGGHNPSSISGITYGSGKVLQGVTLSQVPYGNIWIPQGTLTPQKITIDAWVKVTGPSPGGTYP